VPAAAQDAFPDRPVRIVVPFPPGGITDLATRLIANEFRREFGQPAVVENRAGGNSVIGTAWVGQQPADGHALLMTSGPFIIVPALQRDLPFDAGADFAAISLVVSAPNVLLVRPDQPMRTVADLVAEAQRRPGAIAYASSGVGSTVHVTGALLERAAGISLNHIPYRGSIGNFEEPVAGPAGGAIRSGG
jgi:tripartite-type tricarboxylate transporter receptor subunit TctC